MNSSSKDSLSYWYAAEIGDIIQLKDEQTISYLMEQGCEHISHGADFTIVRRRSISSQDSSSKWLILDIELNSFLWQLVIKSNNEDFDLYVYYTPDGFVDGDRNDILSNSDWLMEEHAGEKPLKDLFFAIEIQQGDDVIFKTDGPQFGVCTEEKNKSFATIVEYSTDSSEETNPLLMAIELNKIEKCISKEKEVFEDCFGNEVTSITSIEDIEINEDSSYIMLLQGCRVLSCDVDLLRIK